MSGTPCVAITASNRPATSSGSAASQAKVAAAVSWANAASRSGLRDASATCSPLRANNRASEALSPLPTPTINADFSSIGPLLDCVRLIRTHRPARGKPHWCVRAPVPVSFGRDTGGDAMLGLMQTHNLTVSSLLLHAARHHANGEIVSQGAPGVLHRSTWADTERGARRLVRALQVLGIGAQDRVG